MRSPRVALALVLLALCVGNVAVTFMRSGIPYDLEGMVRGVERRLEKKPGRDDVYIVTVGKRALHLDRDLGARLIPGDLLSKPAWERVLRIGDVTLELAPSRDFRGMVGAMPLVLVLGVLVLVFGRKRTPSPAGATPVDRGRMDE